MREGGGFKTLRIAVFVVGLGEFLTSILLLFLPELYKSIFGLARDFDSYYIRQIGMFQFLVGSALLVASREAENPPVARFAVYFNVVSAVFWIDYLIGHPGQRDLFHATVVGFLIYHTIMTAFLLSLLRKAGIPILTGTRPGGEV